MTRVAIVGGGIAGLALAATLDDRRFDTTVYEAQPERAGGGAALGIWSSAERALQGVGVDIPASFPTDGYAVHHVSGRRLVNPPPIPVKMVERARLLQALDAAVSQRVRRAEAEVLEPESIDADLVVGADGVRSRVRAVVDPRRAERRATPYIALRGILRNDPTTSGEGEYWGRGLIFGRQRLTEADTYWFAAWRSDASEPLVSRALLDEAADRFKNTAPLIRSTLAASDDDVLATRLWVTAPMWHYIRGRFVVIGDAAHAATPNLGRGACSAILDAVSLGNALNAGTELRRWQRRRVSITQAERVAAAIVMGFAARLP